MEDRLKRSDKLSIESVEDIDEMKLSIDFVRKCFEVKGNLSPMVIGTAEKGRYVVPFLHKDNNEKYILAKKIKEEFKKVGVTAIVVMTEAWMVKQKAGMIDTSIRPSEHPLKQEIVMVNLLEKNKYESAIIPIIRSEKEVILGEPITSKQTGAELRDNLFGDYFKEAEK